MFKMTIVKKALKLEDKYKDLTQEELIENLFCTNNIVNKLASAREIIFRTTNLKLFPNQMLGALHLADGKIIEMKTGEGKTVVALAASLLLVSIHKKVHIITVNEYLTERDAIFAKPTYEYINKKCNFILSTTLNKKEIYDNSDLIYITNSELGFDYLRSNSGYSESDIVFNNDNAFAIIDEADSILIDEAKIPLILSAPKNLKAEDYKKAQYFVKTLKNDDYEIEPKERRVYLTGNGAKKCEKYFELDNYSSIQNNLIRHLVDNALMANYIMKKDIDYILKDNEVKLIDTNTGRIAEGRRFNKGLHQALEAKENKEIKPESATLGSITYQKLFTLYKDFAGMTGTIMSEKQELKEIYNKKPVYIPSNKPIIRKDNKDLFFKNNDTRDAFLIKIIKENNQKGRPILVGTESIVESERIAKLLKKNNLSFNLLNAKNDKNEAEIIALAGEKGSITIATNMAGRGTDIKLGEGVRELGGLLVIGIGHYNFIRIDNQLRGRSGRQGDPGETIFLVSLEDTLIKTLVSGNVFGNLLDSLTEGEDEGISNKGLEKAIKRAQKTYNTIHFNARKQTTDYDNILSIYRNMFFKDRMRVLKSQDDTELINYFNKDGIDITNIQKLLKKEVPGRLKQYILNIMDINWMNFLDISEDLKNESSYNSYSGTKSIVLYEDAMANAYNTMLRNIVLTINNEFKKA